MPRSHPPTATAIEPQPDAARAARQRAVTDVRRALVLAAAKSAFLELGLDGASLREIAKRAGYTPGAIYSYFSSKEEVYGALLGESLERLNARVATSVAAPDDASASGCSAPARRRLAERTLRAKATAFFEFYRESPRDLDLGFYLFHGMQPRGLTPTLNEQLNASLREALQPARQAIEDLGWTAEGALAETTALFAHTVGLLPPSHTGRIRMFGQQSEDLFGRYLDELIARAPRRTRQRDATPCR